MCSSLSFLPFFITFCGCEMFTKALGLRSEASAGPRPCPVITHVTEDSPAAGAAVTGSISSAHGRLSACAAAAADSHRGSGIWEAGLTDTWPAPLETERAESPVGTRAAYGLPPRRSGEGTNDHEISGRLVSRSRRHGYLR